MPRINFTWFYVLIVFGLIGLYLAKMMGTEHRTNWAEFEKWARKGHVERLVVVNEKEAYVYIKRDSLGFGDHKNISAEQPKGLNVDMPTYVFNIGKPEVGSGGGRRIERRYILLGLGDLLGLRSICPNLD